MTADDVTADVLTVDPDDPANPDCDAATLARAEDADPARLGPDGSELLRYGWASAALDAHPELHLPWAGTGDRAVRRAVMRSPSLPSEAAELVVATRRSGMHTLGANPVAPVELLERNPSARRRRAAVLELLPGGLDEARRNPDRPELVELGNGTVDLVLAHAPELSPEVARLLVARTDPLLDPWSAAVLVERYGAPVWRTWTAHVRGERRRAVAALSVRAAALAGG
jgi:hypothetical protein